MTDFLTIEDIKAAISELPFDIDPRFAGLKEIISPYIPAGSHIYENERYMVFHGEDKTQAYAIEKRDWTKPMEITPPVLDDDFRYGRMRARYGLW